MKNTKQVIIWRNDLKVRTGKKMAMASHASMAFLTKDSSGVIPNQDTVSGSWFEKSIEDKYADDINHWLENSFRKIVCYVNSEEELLEVHQKALDAGLISHLIEDNGATEFNGVKTKTCIAIGPHWDEKFNGITDHLPLL
jgi:PTH2 family peptidyl-tRNA hydrolase